jgi:hypothetical protein
LSHDLLLEKLLLLVPTIFELNLKVVNLNWNISTCDNPLVNLYYINKEAIIKILPCSFSKTA